MSIRSREKSSELVGVISEGGFIQYATSAEHDRAKKLNGRVVFIKPKNGNRSLKFHRKFFALINLGFGYWSPTYKTVSDPEEKLAHDVAKLFCELAGNPDLYHEQGIEIAQLAIQNLALKRMAYLDPEAYKSEETYRRMVMIEAGFYELEYLPNGGAIKVPWSIAFDNMEPEQFEKIYKGCSGVIWNKSLFQIFEDKEQMDRAVNQLMGFI
ncbi:conserved hypothetical protein [Vibrio crassostreae]|nr:conserved hypothetical protein [Vibrio crassostreae]